MRKIKNAALTYLTRKGATLKHLPMNSSQLLPRQYVLFI